MDGGAWWAAVHGVAKSRTRLSNFTFPFHFHALEKEMATHCSVLAWRIPGTGEPGGLPSMGSHRLSDTTWSDVAAAASPSSLHVDLVKSSILPPWPNKSQAAILNKIKSSPNPSKACIKLFWNWNTHDIHTVRVKNVFIKATNYILNRSAQSPTQKCIQRNLCDAVLPLH